MSTSSPRILFVCHDASRTGAPIGLLAFMRWLKSNTGFELATVVRIPGPLAEDFGQLGPMLTLGASVLHRTRLGRRIRHRLPSSWVEETRAIRRFFAAGRFDVIYSNTITNGPVLEALGSFGTPVITHVHELEYWISRTGAENLRAVKACTSSYIAASQAVSDNLVHNHGVPAERITTVYEHIRELPTVSSDEQRTAARTLLKIPTNAFVIGGCGAEHWRKGRDLIPQLLIALRRLAPEQPFHFVWVGRPGTAEEQYSLHYDLRTAGVDHLYHDSGETCDPLSLFASFDAFALLSRDDPYPLACLEVAALERPVVCFTGAGGIPEFVRGDCGLAAPYLDLEAMARDFVRLAQDPALARRYGTNARAKVARENLLDATGPQLCRVIENCLKRAPS